MALPSLAQPFGSLQSPCCCSKIIAASSPFLKPDLPPLPYFLCPLHRSITQCTDELPRDRPVYSMGIGMAEDLLVIIALGVDMVSANEYLFLCSPFADSRILRSLLGRLCLPHTNGSVWSSYHFRWVPEHKCVFSLVLDSLPLPVSFRKSGTSLFVPSSLHL